MKDPRDTLTPDLFASAPTQVPEFEGISYTLYADHEHEVITLLAHRDNSFSVFYDQQARDFWHDYIAELKINGFNADEALEMLWRQHDEL
jgi:hypothetical protein